MTVFKSKIHTGSPGYAENAQHMTALCQDLAQKRAIAAVGGPTAAQKKHTERGKMLVRARVERLLDPGSPFLELSQLAAQDVYGSSVPGAGLITGIGTVSSRLCLIIANDATVKGGTYFPLTVKKHLRAQEIAAQNNLPCLYLVDSGGANLPFQTEVFPDKDHFGRIFYNQARLSALGIPQFAAVMGSCTAGGAYVPAMSDIVVMVRDQASIFLGGPPLVKAATGETVSAEDLGGTDVHIRRSGLADYEAASDEHALEILRTCISQLPPTQNSGSPSSQTGKDVPPLYPAPLYSAHELDGVVPIKLSQHIDAREIICRLVDGSEFDEFKKDYGTTLITGFADIGGHKVGILANNGILYAEAAQKAAHFIALCCQRETPLIFLQNVSGFMVGQAYEAGGIAKEGAKMVRAVAAANVPKITILTGGSFGAGNYAMCGRAFAPRFLFAWPNARISVMGGPQAANVLSQIRRGNAKHKGTPWSKEAEEQFKADIEAKYEDEGHPYYATARLWDDGIIMPSETRNVLILALSIGAQAPTAPSDFGVFRM